MPARRPRPSLEIAHRFLCALDFEGNASTEHWFQSYDESGKDREFLVRSLHGSLDACSKELLQLNETGAGIHVVINLTDGVGKVHENIVAPRACFIDFDNVQPDLDAFPLPPSLVVRSAHGPHVYWMLRAGQPLSRWAHLQTLLAEAHDGDLKTRKLVRLQRVPGFLHRKAEPVEIGIERCTDPVARYTLDEIAHAWGVEIKLLEAEEDEREREERAEARRQSPPKPVRQSGPSALERARRYIDSVPGAAKGDRNDHTSKHIASAGYDFGIDLDLWIDEVIGWNERRNNPPLSKKDVVSLVRSTYRSLQRRSKDAPGWKLNEDSPEWQHKQAEQQRTRKEREADDEAAWASRLADEDEAGSGAGGSGGGGDGGGGGGGGGSGGRGDDDERGDDNGDEPAGDDDVGHRVFGDAEFERKRAADMRLSLEHGVEALLHDDMLAHPSFATPPSVDGFPLTVRGNVMRALADHQPTVRFCPPLDLWFCWDGTRWKQDGPGYINSLVSRRMSAMHTMFKSEVLRFDPSDSKEERKSKAARRENIWKHICKSERASAVREVVEMMSWQPTCKVMTEKLDKHDDLINTRSGTVDTATLEQKPHEPTQYHTMVTNAPFDPTAECPTWMKFLHWAMRGDKELVSFLQRAAGYTATGYIREHVFFLCYGNGSNGKSTYLNTLVHVLGDYATYCDIELFMLSKAQSSANAANEEMLALRGARMVYAFEPNEGRALMESRIKQVTGGEPITARPLYGRPVTFRPNFSLWLATNHRPVIRGTDDGIWRRVLLIPWRAKIAGEEKDEELPRKLEREAAGIMRWILEGARQWRQVGLCVPKSIKESTNDYREEMDLIGTFLEQCCVVDDDHTAQSSKLYDVFKAWCETQGEGSWKQRTFKERLREHGIDCVKRDGLMTFLGISIAPDHQKQLTMPNARPDWHNRD